MTQELHPVLRELEAFCNRNLGNRLSVDLCESLFVKIQAVLNQLMQNQSVQNQSVQNQSVQNQSTQRTSTIEGINQQDVNAKL